MIKICLDFYTNINYNIFCGVGLTPWGVKARNAALRYATIKLQPLVGGL